MSPSAPVNNASPPCSVHAYAETSADCGAHCIIARKRDRDKINQRNKHRREQEYVFHLETKVHRLENLLQQQNPGNGTNHETPVEAEQAADTILPNVLEAVPSVAETSSLQQIVSSLATVDHGSAFVTSAQVRPALPNLASPHTTTHSLAAQRSGCLLVREARMQQLLDAPEWLRMPLSDMSTIPSFEASSQLVKTLLQLQKDPDSPTYCPADPKPIDLLYAGSSNILANAVVAGASDLPLLPPERFASSWMVYKFCRWLVWPSRETFCNLPDFCRPTLLQLTEAHKVEFDFILWPRFRDNLIKHGAKFDLERLVGFLACTYRIRGCFNKEFICRVNDGDLQICPSFYEQISKIENWGILESFWHKYPDLVEGLDTNLMFREQNLMPATS
ncbi:hypothetical protein HBI81_184210 [Parastagonospora nodorum]|nr:hypothetical protein HBH51_224130 [Parastagonospora nodorum]KAH4899208.1 hypothetical protein HBI80_174850 [Parastagonospora nodorum]KAH5101423.1 hypothetical protein HBH71_225410 [Parastagonospora nodorum]KAH5166029.1 hypothetical protein HBH68_241160 [Parastagonospora nodorum]KAH5642112.1 hypothetical protein HBI23_197650 [Parastagonospora nodorum]